MTEGTPDRGTTDAAQQRIRRSTRLSGFVGGLSTLLVVVEGLRSQAPWWLVLAFGLLWCPFAVWSSARAGRVISIRKEALRPDEILLSAYRVSPSVDGSRTTEHT